MTRKTLGLLACTLFASPLLGGCAAKRFTSAELDDLTTRAEGTVADMKLREDTFEQAYDASMAQAVFPRVGRAAFWLGLGLGSGVVFENGEVTGVCRATHVGLYGIGGGYTQRVVLFNTQQALDDFKDGDAAFSGQGDAMIGTSGVGYTEDAHSGADEFSTGGAGALLQLGGGGSFYTFREISDARKD